MSYKYEQNTSGGKDLVISGFEAGIADSPLEGIGNIRNLNIRYYKGVTYVNYKRKAATITGATFGIPAYQTQSPAGIIYISDTGGQIFKQTALNGSTFALLTGGTADGTIRGARGLQFWNNYLVAFGVGTIHICGDGTGDAGVTSSNWDTAAGTGGVLPISPTIITTTAGITPGATSATLSSYTDAQGNVRAFWNGPTGSYTVFLGGIAAPSQVVIATLTQNSTAITWAPAASSSAGATIGVSPVTSGQHPSLVSINDGNLYFANGSNVGDLELLPFQIFVKTKMSGTNWRFNSAVLPLSPSVTINSLVELRNQLLLGTAYAIYPWDRISSLPLNPVPMGEQLYGMINILNNIYVFAGNKGNIYLSNGYNLSRYKKMPDFIAGVVDPVWQWGGIMTHRQNLVFQALASNGQTGVPIIAGIFSINLDDETLVMTSQNSFGLASATTTSPGLLIDNNSIALNYDNYYSAWANGNSSVGGIDYNDTTLWSSNEAVIETDLIPIGTNRQLKTFASAEFKLDQPMQSGDSISLYGRPSLSDSYILIGTTTSAVLSDFISTIPFDKWQWAQFKVTMSCNATSTASSFMPLREIRLR